MISTIPKNLSIVYNAQLDRLEALLPKGVPALSKSMLRAACDVVYRIDLLRYNQTPPGDRKDIFRKKLEACKNYKIVQILGGKGDVPLFNSNQKLGTKIYSHG